MTLLADQVQDLRQRFEQSLRMVRSQLLGLDRHGNRYYAFGSPLPLPPSPSVFSMYVYVALTRRCVAGPGG